MNTILEKIKKHSKPLSGKLSKEQLVNNNSSDPVKLFESEAVKTDSVVVLCAGIDEAYTKLNEIFADQNSLVFSGLIDESFVNKMKELNPGKKVVTVTEIESNLKDELSKINISVSRPEYIIAETGTAVMRTSKEEPRLLSVLADISVILAKKEQIIPSMSDFLKLSKEKIEDFNKTSAYVFITGPSRTADIEKILVIGVHGPGKLIYILY